MTRYERTLKSLGHLPANDHKSIHAVAAVYKPIKNARMVIINSCTPCVTGGIRRWRIGIVSPWSILCHNHTPE